MEGIKGTSEGTLSKIAQEIIARAERMCGGKFETRESAEQALKDLRRRRMEAVRTQCRRMRGIDCDRGCTRACAKDKAYAAARRERKAAKVARIAEAPPIAPAIEQPKRRIPGGKVKKAKKPKTAADKGLKKIIVEERRMIDHGVVVVDRSEASARTISVFRLSKRLKLNQYQEAACRDFSRDWETATSSLRSPGFDPRVEGGSIVNRHVGALEAQRRIELALQKLGEEDFMIVVGAVIHGFSASRIHAAGGQQHIVASELIRRAIRNLASVYNPGARRPDRTLQAIAKLIHEAQEGREDGAAELLSRLLAKAKEGA